MSGLTFADPALGELFDENGWRRFDDLWRLEASEVEPGNVRRGGWSSVVRFTAGDGSAYYLKRQEDHDYRTWEGKLVRRPTVSREWQAGVAFRALGISTAEPVCLGVEQSRTSRGLLVTRALDDYEALSDVLPRLPGNSDSRRSLWYQVADEVRLIHAGGFRHNCLYGQHVMVRESAEGWDCAFIDLEKVSKSRSAERSAIADLSALERHTDDMSVRDREWLWDRYFRDTTLKRREKLLRILAGRTAERAVGRYIRDCAAGRRGDMAKGPSR